MLDGIHFNGVTLWFGKSRHFLDKRCGSQAKCWLDNGYILQEIGDIYIYIYIYFIYIYICALLVLNITVFEVNNLNNSDISVWIDGGWTAELGAEEMLRELIEM